MTKALLLIDLQNDYFPGGAMELTGSTIAVTNAAKLLGAFRRTGLPVIHIQHISASQGATFFLPDTTGVRIHDAVAPAGDETVFQKHYPNSFRETALLGHLRDNGISRLVIAGMMTHMCIDATTRAASDQGFSCILAHDACATRPLSFGGVDVPAGDVHAAFLAALNGLYARVMSVDEICTGL